MRLERLAESDMVFTTVVDFEDFYQTFGKYCFTKGTKWLGSADLERASARCQPGCRSR